jgi:hypothetical protein
LTAAVARSNSCAARNPTSSAKMMASGESMPGEIALKARPRSPTASLVISA